MTHKLAQALSTLLHPLMMPTLLSALLLYFSPSVFGVTQAAMQWRLLFLIFTTTFLIPLLSIVLMFRVRSFARSGTHDPEQNQENQVKETADKETSMLASLEMKEKNDRFMPFLTTTVFYMVTTYLFLRQMNSYYTLVVVLGGITFSIALVTLISVFWKISAHSVGINGVAGFLFGFYQKYGDPLLFYPILFIILMAGILMSARLLLNTHNPSQVFAGAALGWAVSFFTVYLLI